MLSDAVSYPQSGNGWQSVLIGGILKLFNLLLIPAFVVFGYYIHVLRGAVFEEKAPQFEDFSELFIDGLKSFVIFLGYIFTPLLLIVVLVFGTALIGGGNGSGVLRLIIILIGIMFLFGMFYLFPVALTAFAITDDLRTAFKIRTIVESAFTGDYAVSVFLSVVFRVTVAFLLATVSFIIQMTFSAVFLFGLVGLNGSEPSIGVGVGFAFLAGILILMALGVVFSIVDFYTKVAMYHLLGRGSGASLCDSLAVDRPAPAAESDNTPTRLDE